MKRVEPAGIDNSMTAENSADELAEIIAEHTKISAVEEFIVGTDQTKHSGYYYADFHAKPFNRFL
jgi:hypothetical protein